MIHSENRDQAYIRRVVLQAGQQRYAMAQSQTTLQPIVTPISDAIRVLSVEDACRHLFFTAAGFCLNYYDVLPRDVTATLNALYKAANGQLTRRATLAAGIEFFERSIAADFEDVGEALRVAKLSLMTLQNSSAKLAAIKAAEAERQQNWLLR